MPNIWNATTVESEPQKWLEKWLVYKVIDAKIQPEVFGYHFVGYDPGTDPDAQYTLNGWAAANQVTIMDTTEEFIQHYKINLDQVRALGRQL